MDELIAKYLSGEASAEEADEVRQWRAANEANSRHFLELKMIWSESTQQEPADPQVFQRIMTKHDQPKIIPLWNQRLFRFAAALVLIAAAVFFVINLSEQQPYGQVLAENTEFKLPDGSIVTVQHGGMLTLGDFKETRDVYLTGKAFFEVRRNEKKSFQVSTNGAIIQVLGTSFMVKNRSNDSRTEVMVESGSVALKQNPESFKVNPIAVQLEQGEMGELQIGVKGIRKKRITDDNYLSWKTGLITFRKQSMSKVSEVLTDVYDVDIEFENEEFKNCSLTASFKDKPVEEVVKIIAETFSVSYSKSGNSIHFQGQGCN